MQNLLSPVILKKVEIIQNLDLVLSNPEKVFYRSLVILIYYNNMLTNTRKRVLTNCNLANKPMEKVWEDLLYLIHNKS